MNDGLFHASNLIRIYLEGCSECVIIPQFGQLPNLKSIKLSFLNKVDYMDNCSSEGSIFLSLEYIQLIGMPKLKEWWRRDLLTHSPTLFPHLSELMIVYCEELQSLELQSSPLLSSLKIQQCPKLRSALLPPCPHLSNLEIHDSRELTSFKMSYFLSRVYSCIR